MPFRSSRSINSQAYIPQHVQQAMNQHLQRTAPAHLKKYVGTGTYVPRRAEKALAQHIQKTAPGHLKQYSGAYVQQQIVEPGLSRGQAAPTPLNPRPPTPVQTRLDHSNVPGAQYDADFNTNLFAPDQPTSPTSEPQPSAPNPTEQPYEFIMNPQQPHRRLTLPGGDSRPARIAYLVGGLVVLFILFNFAKGLLSNTPDFTPFYSVAQDQQELIHLSSNALIQQDLSTVNKNFAYTSRLSLSTAQSDIVTYLANNKKKINNKTLNFKVNAATDTRLTQAAAATTYNQTFKEIMQDQLKTYSNDLGRAYQQTTGKKGRALLKDDYAQAQLLQKLLDQTAT